ncbi:FAD-dependent oxidoreductase, partial [Rhizobium hidalgonense]
IRNPRLLNVLIAYLKQLPNVSMHAFVEAKEFQLTQQRINGLVDTAGNFWQADQYVIANGAWAGLLSQKLPQAIPVKPIQGQMILFKAPPHWLPSMVMHHGIYVIPRLDGHIVCGSSTDDVGFNTDVNSSIDLKLKQAAYQMIPDLQQMP